MYEDSSDDFTRHVWFSGDGTSGVPLFKAGSVGSGVLPGAPAVIRVVTLNFLANDGDGYPMKANGSNFRYVLEGGELGPVIGDEGLNFTVSPQLPGDALGEQAALAGYLFAFRVWVFGR